MSGSKALFSIYAFEKWDDPAQTAADFYEIVQEMSSNRGLDTMVLFPDHALTNISATPFQIRVFLREFKGRARKFTKIISSPPAYWKHFELTEIGEPMIVTTESRIAKNELIEQSAHPPKVNDVALTENLGSIYLDAWFRKERSRALNFERSLEFFRRTVQIYDKRYPIPLWQYVGGAPRVLDSLSQMTGSMEYYEKAANICRLTSKQEITGLGVPFQPFEEQAMAYAYDMKKNYTVFSRTGSSADSKQVYNSIAGFTDNLKTLVRRCDLEPLRTLYLGYYHTGLSLEHLFDAKTRFENFKYPDARHLLQVSLHEAMEARRIFEIDEFGRPLGSLWKIAPPQLQVALCRLLLSVYDLKVLQDIRAKRLVTDALGGIIDSCLKRASSPGYEIYKMVKKIAGYANSSPSSAVSRLEETDYLSTNYAASPPIVPCLYVDFVRKIVFSAPVFQDEYSSKRALEIQHLSQVFQGHVAGIDEGKIIAWLKQFGVKWKRQIALQILRNIARSYYFDLARVLSLSRQLHHTLPTNFRNNAYFVGLGPGTKSGQAIASYWYRIATGINAKKQSPVHGLSEVARDKELSDKAVVFLDDLVGTGDEAITYYNLVRTDLENLPCPVYYFAFAGFDDAIRRVESQTKFVVRVGCRLNDSDMCFSERSRVFKSQKLRDRARKLIEMIGTELWPSDPLGYRGTQALVVFFYNTPNNSLPIIWKSGRFQGKEWVPIFPRYYPE